MISWERKCKQMRWLVEHKICPCYSPSFVLFSLYHSFIPPRTNPDKRHWLLQCCGRERREAPRKGAGTRTGKLLSFFPYSLRKCRFGFSSDVSGKENPPFFPHSAYGQSDRSPEHEVSVGLRGLDPSTTAFEGFEWYHGLDYQVYWWKLNVLYHN